MEILLSKGYHEAFFPGCGLNTKLKYRDSLRTLSCVALSALLLRRSCGNCQSALGSIFCVLPIVEALLSYYPFPAAFEASFDVCFARR